MKDKNNIAPLNIWSAGEYLNTREGFLQGENNILTVSDNYSIIGETCIKSTRIGDVGTYFDNYRFTDLNEGDTITVSAYICNPECQCTILLYSYSPSSNISRLTVPKSKNINKISISGKIIPYTSYITMRCFVNELNCNTYIDNIEVTIS